jgi:hypothetical protein
MKVSRLFAACAAVLALGTSVPFRPRSRTKKGSTKSADIPQCGKVLGTIALVDGDGRAGRNTSSARLHAAEDLRVQVRLLQARQPRRRHGRDPERAGARRWRQPAERLERRRRPDQDRGLAAGGGHRRPEPELRRQHVGAIAGGLLGGKFGGLGALAGGINTKKVEAQTVLSLVNTRTSEEEYNIEGFAKKSDMSFAGGAAAVLGWDAPVAAPTPAPTWARSSASAFLDAYRQLVTQMGGMSANVVAAAPRQSFIATAAFELKRSPSKSSGTVRKIESGMMLYPLGGKEDMWWEVEDENGNVGWVLNTKLAPMAIEH